RGSRGGVCRGERTRCRCAMLDHAREAVAMVRGRTRRDVDTDRMLQLAITRLVEIIGEAAGRVSKEGQQRYADIEWPAVIAPRLCAIGPSFTVYSRTP